MLGFISVKNIYEALSNLVWKKKKGGWWKKLWNWECQMKIKLFSWLLAKDEILSWKNLQKRGWKGPGICSLCKAHSESTKHIFFKCPFTRSVWEELKKTMKLEKDGMVFQWLTPSKTGLCRIIV